MFSKRRALRDFQDFKDLIEQTWREIATEDDAGNALDNFTFKVFSGSNIRYGRNAIFTTMFRLHQIRVDALSDGQRRSPESGETIDLMTLANTIALAIAPRLQALDSKFDVDTTSSLVYRWFPVSAESAERLDFNRDHHRDFAALLLALTADFTQWDSLSGIYTASGFRKALRSVEYGRNSVD